MARTMLNENTKYLWAEAVNTTCYVLNHVLIKPYLNKTPYELWKDRKSNISYFKVPRCKCFILNTKDNLGKFDPKSYVGIFLVYSNTSKAYKVYNKILKSKYMLRLMNLTLTMRKKLLLMMMQIKSYKKNH